MLRPMRHLPTLDRKMRAVSTLVTPLALQGLAFASVPDQDLRGVKTIVLRAVWRTTALFEAKEVVLTVHTGEMRRDTTSPQ